MRGGSQTHSHQAGVRTHTHTQLPASGDLVHNESPSKPETHFSFSEKDCAEVVAIQSDIGERNCCQGCQCWQDVQSAGQLMGHTWPQRQEELTRRDKKNHPLNKQEFIRPTARLMNPQPSPRLQSSMMNKVHPTQHIVLMGRKLLPGLVCGPSYAHVLQCLLTPGQGDAPLGWDCITKRLL